MPCVQASMACRLTLRLTLRKRSVPVPGDPQLRPAPGITKKEVAQIRVLPGAERKLRPMEIVDKSDCLILLNAPTGTCPECAVKHDPTQPHDRQSLHYQYHFHGQHGRWPTWADAMAHCSADVQKMWIDELAEHGIEVAMQ